MGSVALAAWRRRALRAAVLRWAGYGFALVLFVVIVVLRGGPSTGDAFAVTQPTTQLAAGNLHAAAAAQSEYQPPGYALLAAPFVAAFGAVDGSPTWCDAGVPAADRALVPQCAPGRLAAERWYRSQALLGILAWVVLVAGCVTLVRASRPARPAQPAQLGPEGPAGPMVALGLAVLPFASDALVQSFHPQDLVSVGLLAAAVAQALRRRWLLAGVLLGVAFTCKQFALLPLVALVVAVPGWRQRLKLLAPAVLVVSACLLPFLVADRSVTLGVLEAVNGGGAGHMNSGTVVGLAPLSASAKLFVARVGALVLAVCVSAWVRRRRRDAPLAPVPLIGLVAACLAARLVFEVLFYGYYLLAVGAALFVLDVASKRPPIVSIAWVAATAVVVGNLAHLPLTLSAAMWLVASVAAMVVGVQAAVPRPGVALPSPAAFSSL